MKKPLLLTPGPTQIPEDVLLSMAEPIIHHRTGEFRKIFDEVNSNLKYVFQTKNPVFIFSSSGTGAMETSVTNFLSKGDKAIVVIGGKFGERWSEICKAYGIEVIPIEVSWDKAVEPQDIAKVLKEYEHRTPQTTLSVETENCIKAVYTTLCETSTGVVNDIESIAKIVKETNAILVVDAISGLGACELKTDEWGIDVVVAGSQKGLMIPPGLGFISVSEKAWQKHAQAELPRYYFDLAKAKKALAESNTPFTASVTLILALNRALLHIKSEGLENVLKRHSHLGKITREAVCILGLKLFTASASSNAVTSVYSPEGINSQELVKLMREKYGVAIAGGQGKLKGKIFRIAHLGYVQDFDIIKGISALEKALKDLGYKFELGCGVRKAQEMLLKVN